ncbi:MAG: hypothetical protein IPL65_17735 [Lewinellaceae bacterium]|nr:hypothetical protein [Lewinellaceae bacterium]
MLRKKIFLSNQGASGTWLEGIGSLDWVFTYPAYVQSVSGGYTFVCHSVSDSIVYPDGASASLCGINAVSNLQQKSAIKISPNPCS